jgi:hypothetical protein
MKEALCVAMLLVCGVAHAGEKERAAKREDEKTLKDAADAFKAACGCPLKIDVQWDGFKTERQLFQVKLTGENIKSSVDGFCKAAEGAADNKKVICTMKSLEIVNGQQGLAAFDKGKAVATLTDNSYITFDIIKSQVDK